MDTIRPPTLLWKRFLHLLWRGRSLYLQVAIIAVAAWLLWPLRDAARLPNPPVPTLTAEPPERQEALLMGTDLFSPGTQGVMRVLVVDPDRREPLPGVDVQAYLRAFISSPAGSDAGEPIFTGQTDAYGSATIGFDIPANAQGDYELVVNTAGPVGAQQVTHPFSVQRQVQLDLNTDNVLYHPGQFIYLSLLASDATTGTPLSGRPVTLTVIDARQNPIWSKRTTTSEFGLAAAQCELADKIGGGIYRVMAVLDVPGQAPVPAEKTVHVEPIRSDPFDLAISTDSDIYLPGQRLSVTVQVSEGWGQPISGTQIVIQPTLDTPAQHKLDNAQGTTDVDGALDLTLLLPESLPATDEIDRLYLTVEAVAPDSRTARREIHLPVASQAIHVQIQAESGALKPTLENVILIQTTYPDGQPASCTVELEVNGQNVVVTTDRAGLARWHTTPAHGQSLSLRASARDRSGASGTASVTLAIEPGQYHLVLRPKQGAIIENETVDLDVFTTGFGQAVYLDVLQRGQTVAAYHMPLSQGHGSLQIQAAPVGATPIGTLTLHAYMLLDDGTVISDVKTISVLPHSPLQLSAQVAQTPYEPGETAQVGIQVSDTAGQGIPCALQIALVGTTEADLGFSESDSRPFWLAAQPSRMSAGSDDIAKPSKLSVRYAGVLNKPRPVPDRVRLEFERIAAVRAERQRTFARLAERSVIALISTSALLCIVVLAWLWRQERVKPGTLVSSLLLGVVVLPLAFGGTLLLVQFGQQVFGPGAVVVLGLGWLGVLLTLLVSGWEKGDGGVQLVPVLLVAGLALGWGLFFATAQGGVPGQSRVLVGTAAFAVTVTSTATVASIAAAFALFALGSGLARQRVWSSSIATFAAIVLTWCSVLGTILFGQAAHGEQTSMPNLDIDLTPFSATPTAPLSVSIATPATTSLPEWPWPGQRWETLAWHPITNTDHLGQTTLSIPVVQDSLLYVRASTLQGEHALAQVQFDVQTPLDVQVESPASLTVGDVFEIPVSVNTNQLLSQTFRLTVTQAAWFRLPVRGADAQTINVSAGERGQLTVPIQAREWGTQALTMTLSGTQTPALTLTHPIPVLPDGQPVIRHYNRQTNEVDTYKIQIPWSAVQDSERIAVRVYTGWSSILAEGLQSALAHRGLDGWVSRQVVSPTLVSTPIPYPLPFSGDALGQLLAETNHLLLLRDYLSITQKWTVPLKAQIERALALNGQRLLTFESNQGSFSLFGQSDGDLVQTASALMTLSKLETIDSRIVERIATSLLARQTGNGTWLPPEVPAAWQQLPRPELPFTAYVTWALIDAGYGDKPGIQAAVTYLARYQDQAQDPYTLALTIHALAAYRDANQRTVTVFDDPAVTSGLTIAGSRLAEMANVEEGLASWQDRLGTLEGTRDEAADVERAALASWALLRLPTQPELVAQALALLADRRDAFGTWGSPHTTCWALRAFAAALQADPAPVLPAQDAAVRVSVGALRADAQDMSTTIVIPASGDQAADARDTVYHFYFDAPAKGYNDVRIEVSGGPIFYQLLAQYVLPWNQVPPPASEEERVSLALSYEQTSVDVGQTVAVTAGINLNRAGMTPLVVLNLGLPPGVEPIMQEWQEMVEKGLIARYERADTYIRAYLIDLAGERPVNLVYHLRGKTPCAALTHPTWALDIANPQQPTWREPVRIEVKRPQ